MEMVAEKRLEIIDRGQYKITVRRLSEPLDMNLSLDGLLKKLKSERKMAWYDPSISELEYPNCPVGYCKAFATFEFSELVLPEIIVQIMRDEGFESGEAVTSALYVPNCPVVLPKPVVSLGQRPGDLTSWPVVALESEPDGQVILSQLWRGGYNSHYQLFLAYKI